MQEIPDFSSMCRVHVHHLTTSNQAYMCWSGHAALAWELPNMKYVLNSLTMTREKRCIFTLKLIIYNSSAGKPWMALILTRWSVNLSAQWTTKHDLKGDIINKDLLGEYSFPRNWPLWYNAWYVPLITTNTLTQYRYCITTAISAEVSFWMTIIIFKHSCLKL